MRLIDADARIEVQFYDGEFKEWSLTTCTVEEYLNYASEMPQIIDAVPVVRCKDCINNILGENYNPLARHKKDCIFKPDNWFCADGERKADDT